MRRRKIAKTSDDIFYKNVAAFYLDINCEA
jgi:hypothetical protein